jgi:hypothetical protein
MHTKTHVKINKSACELDLLSCFLSLCNFLSLVLPSLPWAQIFSRASIFGHPVSIVLLARETDTRGETTDFLTPSVYAVFAPFAHKLFLQSGNWYLRPSCSASCCLFNDSDSTVLAV